MGHVLSPKFCLTRRLTQLQARAPSRDKTLTNTESIECGQSAASDGKTCITFQTLACLIYSLLIASKIQLKPIPSITEKTFKDLEVFKTPIVPSRYKDAEAVPGFLRSNKSHVPIPMSKKDRIQKPSLGFLMPDEGKGSKKSRHAGKPYGKRGGISKVLERRRAEEEEGRRQGKRILEVIDEDDEMEMDAGPSKRDVGVSTGMLSSSEDEHIRANKDVYGSRASDIGTSASSAMDDPFKQQKASLVSGGRAQPYGRIGRTRTRDPGHRSVPLGRSSNRFAATFDDDDDMDPTKQDTDMQEEISSTPPVFEAPKDFSFAQNVSGGSSLRNSCVHAILQTKPVEHDHDGAKEPPLQSLPFSFVKPADTLAAKPNSPWIDTTVAPKPDSAPLQNPPDTRVQAESLKSSTKAPSPPLFSSSSEKQDTEIPRTNAAKSDDKKPAAGVPNFFANSPLLASKEKESTAPPVSAKSAVPFSFGQPPSSATPSAKEAPALATGPSNATASTSSPFSFGAKVAESGPKPLFGAPAKAQELGAQKSSSSSVDTPSSAPAVTAPALFAPTSEPHSKPAVDATKPVTASPFSFGTSSSASSTVPKPLFGFGSPSGTTPTSTGAAQSFSQNQSTVPRSESKSPFAFGATNTGNATSLSSATATSEQKPMFTFGAATKAPETSAASSPASNVVTAPKPLFGQPSSTLTFNFGNNASVPSSAPATEPPKSTPSPFAFGAPPATPPAVERQASPFNFGAQAPSSSGSMFTFGAKPSETTAPASAPAQASTTSSPFSFGTPQRPITPPSKPDEGMNMEESPNRMDTSTNGNKPGGTITFGSGVTPANPFGQPSQPTTVTTSPFTFGQSSTTGNANPFGQKVENNFTRTSSAPAVSTTFSFGAKPTQPTPPATAFGTPSNPFSQPPQSSGSTSSPFSFGQPPSAPAANPFGAPSQPSATTTTPSTPFGQSATTFSFGAPSNAPPNPFAFGSQPSSPAAIPGGLPQSPATTAPQFTFGAPSSATASPTFNMGPPPPPASGTPTRQMKKLPNRARPPPRR